MKKVGFIKEIWRYPVKGMAGQQVKESLLGFNGIEGDRLWAVRDTLREEIQSCKVRPDLLRCTAEYNGGYDDQHRQKVAIRLPNGTLIGSEDPEIHYLLSELVGHKSTLEYLRPKEDKLFYSRHKKDDKTWLKELKATFEREADEPLPDLDNLDQSIVDNITIPGTFFLVMPLHIVTDATLSHLKKLNPTADWSLERFRPNLVIETLPDMEGLVEQNWLGHTLSIGGSQVTCSSATPRCGAVTKPQQTCNHDKNVLRTIVKKAEQNLGVYAQIEQEGPIKVGDEVYLTEVS